MINICNFKCKDMRLYWTHWLQPLWEFPHDIYPASPLCDQDQMGETHTAV